MGAERPGLGAEAAGQQGALQTALGSKTRRRRERREEKLSWENKRPSCTGLGGFFQIKADLQDGFGWKSTAGCRRWGQSRGHLPGVSNQAVCPPHPRASSTHEGCRRRLQAAARARRVLSEQGVAPRQRPAASPSPGCNRGWIWGGRPNAGACPEHPLHRPSRGSGEGRDGAGVGGCRCWLRARLPRVLGAGSVHVQLPGPPRSERQP